MIDAFFWSGGLFTAGITELGESMALRLVGLDEAAGALRTRYGGVYRTGTIPAGTYRGVDAAVTTVAVPNLLVTLDTTAAATVRRVLDALFASAPQVARDIPAAVQLDPRSAAFTGRLPLHPTATGYYRTHKTAA